MVYDKELKLQLFDTTQLMAGEWESLMYTDDGASGTRTYRCVVFLFVNFFFDFCLALCNKCIHTYTCICVFMYTYIYVCVCVYLYVYIYMYMYTCV